MIHHVPVAERAALLREIRRVVAGPIYVKDHRTTGAIDDARLTVMDGNIPFDGQVKAQYLSGDDWLALASASGYRTGATAEPRDYRCGLHAFVFPNRLETTMRFDPA